MQTGFPPYLDLMSVFMSYGYFLTFWRTNRAQIHAGNVWKHVLTDVSRKSKEKQERKQMMSQPAPGSQLQVREPGASSSYNFKLELERLLCKQTAFAA